MKCPRCKTEGYYEGIFSAECQNPHCPESTVTEGWEDICIPGASSAYRHSTGVIVWFIGVWCWVDRYGNASEYDTDLDVAKNKALEAFKLRVP